MIITKTNRLILRELTPDDAEDFYNLNADPEVMKYTGDAAFTSIEESRVFLENYSDYRKNGYGRWAVLLRENNEFLGWCGLKLNEENLVDLGYRFFRKHWGKGFATESAKAALEFGFEKLQLDEIIGRSAKANTASIKVLEKLKMQFWKEDDCKGISDSVYYRIKKSEWK